MNQDKEGTLRWRFDISTFQLIGRELITDRVTALFELVKNSYDANARKVTVTFENIQPSEDNPEVPVQGSRITIKDDGYGMTLSDVRDKWMVIGTSSKRKERISPSPFNRRCVGEKGIGRFAVDKLGSKVNIITKKAGERQWLNVEIDWNRYSQLMESDGLNLFTDIENSYSYLPADDIQECGTKLVVTDVREPWLKGDIEHFINESARITSPFVRLNPSFRVLTIAGEYGIEDYGVSNTSDLSIATLSYEISCKEGKQESLQYNELTHTIDKVLVDEKIFGGIDFKIYYFEPNDRDKYRKKYKYDPIDGVKIYRDGMLTTPFVETEKDSDNKRDILGIDKRVWANIFDKISSRQFIGILDITKENNPNIIDATNRQDFLDNEEYKALKDFIILQLEALEAYRKWTREQLKDKSHHEIASAQSQVSQFATTVAKIAKAYPQLNEQLKPLETAAKSVDKAFGKAIKLQKESEREFQRKENAYLGIISLRAFSIDIAHSVRTAISKIKSDAKFFMEHYPNPLLEDKFLQYAKEMHEVMTTLSRIVDYELSFSQSNVEFEKLHLAKFIKEEFVRWKENLNVHDIELDLGNMDDSIIINTNRQFLVEILDNLIDNSIKAMSNSEKRLIKVSLSENIEKSKEKIEKDDVKIVFSDTGCGIPLEKREWVFGLYNTTTESQGGAGVGLYIVRARVNSLKGKVTVVDSEYGNVGTTIEINIPLKY